MTSSSSGTFSSHRRSSSRDYDTGFPEMPRTTNWRHPEANTSPDACISAEDVDVAKAAHRHRRSFLYHKYKRTTSHGFIASAMEQEYLTPKEKAALEASDSAIGLEDSNALVAGENPARLSKDGTESMDRMDGSPASLADSHFEHGESPRKRSLFSRIRSHSIRHHSGD
ncbi:hypothetical protein BKA67DRAFT_657425 [Truncatella angustata]|uniref:Uncharacterized protein n=1 Tax=Truncatella angustata TaxID=152316 RepID=A0A9P8UNV3_9PEZI|nr:uncharacterized protein BKA67DRAFT_657425 [Truncatella angustata]KAH6655490.1 hypothetical protein BKA67DRAFT_657425 [Truncatella angustata]